MDGKNMTTLESTGISNEIKKQYGKYEKVCRRDFLISLPSKRKNKGDEC